MMPCGIRACLAGPARSLREMEPPMDLFEAIQKLYAEKESLMRAISALEALQQGLTNGTSEASRSNRGRKSMNSEERQEVSLRMKKYSPSRRGSTREDSRR